MVVCVLGTGLMGAPMARRLAGAGFVTHVWNRSPGKAQALRGDGCRPCASLAGAVSGAAVILSSLTDGRAMLDLVEKVVDTGAAGAGSLWIDTSSTLPDEAVAATRRLGDVGVAFLDAPVSGGVRGATEGSLAIMAGGADATFRRALPVLSVLGRAVRVGPLGSGQMAKLANQMIVAGTIGLVAEAMLFLSEGGADCAAVRDALQGGFADSTILRQHGRRMQARDFAPGGASANQLKDLDNALSVARDLSLDLPMIAQVRARYRRLVDDLGGAALDHAALYLELCDLNGKDIAAP
ncbi:MAG: NAD(P)-dependent oxidoreductase [Rubellimicrobium sp.]|nr:NAD(P)-dependent oxidoreductase [Rubellimicrobium sp.]